MSFVREPRLPPRFLFMEVNKRCNLKCLHCDFWQRNDDDRDHYLSRERKREVVTEFAQMSPYGSVVICGGEPMLDLDEYFGICADARANGLRILSVVNGTRIRNLAMAERLILSGPHDISISLNAHTAELHDRTRGVPGAFDKAVRALRLLVEARDRHPEAKARVIVMGLIYASNYRNITGFYDFVLNDIKADSLKLNFLQPGFGHPGSDPFFAEESDVDGDLLVKLINDADRTHDLGINPQWRDNVGMYFNSLAKMGDRAQGWGTRSATDAHICNTYDRNIMVNHYGMARLCFSHSFRGEQLQRFGDLRRFWNGAGDIRAQMRNCNAFCGISHSVRKESSTLAGRASAGQFAQATKDTLHPSLADRLRRLLGAPAA